MQDSNIIVAKDGDKVIGFVGCGAYRDNTLTEHGEIFAIYVLKEYQGKKVGYELMNAVKRMMKVKDTANSEFVEGEKCGYLK